MVESRENLFEGLKLRQEYRYNPEEIGLSKLVFDKPDPKMHFTGVKTKLVGIDFRSDYYAYELQVTEDKFDRVILPVHLLEAEVEDPFFSVNGMIKGVIRPRVSRSMIDSIAVFRGQPEFHFWLSQWLTQFVGASYPLSASDQVIEAGAMIIDGVAEEMIYPNFRVYLPDQSTKAAGCVFPIRFSADS